jgi:hypothetical protein
MQVIKYIATCSQEVVEFESEAARQEYITQNVLKDCVLTQLTEEVVTSSGLYDRIVYEIKSAMSFGQQLALDFIVENTLLGITQAGMVAKVRDALDAPFRAIETGSIREAIALIKAIPPEKRYPVFVTDARMLTYVNRLEDFLDVERSTSV